MRNIKETVSQVERLMKEWDHEVNAAHGLFPDRLASQSNTYAYWKCEYGHTWKAKINNRYRGTGCPRCAKNLKTSFPEQAVYYYVKKLYPDAISGHKPEFLNGMELDIYIPERTLGIEYDGEAWHTDANSERELLKYQLCKQNGVELWRIKEEFGKRYDSPLAVPADRIFSIEKIRKTVYFEALIHQLLDELDPRSNMRTRKDPRMMHSPVDVDIKRDEYAIREYMSTIREGSLQEKYPEVAKLWHPTKNGNLTPDMFAAHSGVRVWWKGFCGHEWDNPIVVMSRGYGCPFCSGNRVLKGFNDLETVFPEIAAQWHPDLNGDKKPNMYTAKPGHPAYWKCPTCRQPWKTAINNRTVNKRKCPYCAGERPTKGVNDLPTLRPDLMEEWDFEVNIGIDPTDLMPGSNKKVGWKCQKCGYRYKTLISNRAKENGTGCPNCAGQVLHKGVNDLATLFPEVAAEWDFENNEGVAPDAIFPSSNKKYAWKDKYGHRWEATPNSRTGRGKTGCPYCSGNRVLVGFNDIATTNPDIAAEWHPTKNGVLTPSQVTKGYKNKVWFLCPKCGNAYESLISNKRKGYGKCPYCNKGRKNRASRILLVEEEQYFDTLKEAAAYMGKESISLIQMCCKGRVETAYGLHWKYVEKK